MDDHTISVGGARQIIRREGEYWTLMFAGEVCRLKHSGGLDYLAYLLRRPHQQIPAVEIVTGGADPAGGEPVDELKQERARVNVTRSLSATLKRLEPYHPVLFGHLRATLRTGRFCTYSPDPRITATWQSAYE